MLISDAGQVYAFGKESFGEAEYGVQGGKLVTTPQLVESLKNIFVVQAAIGNFFTAVLSREGRVYTHFLGVMIQNLVIRLTQVIWSLILCWGH